MRFIANYFIVCSCCSSIPDLAIYRLSYTNLYFQVDVLICGCPTNQISDQGQQFLSWVKASSESIVCDMEVCEGIAIICGRFIAIYGD